MVLDFSNNNFTGALTYDTLRILGLYYLSIRGNPLMRAQSIPTVLQFTSSATFYSGQFYCFSLDIGYQFLYDPQYYNYEGCLCNPGFYGYPESGCLHCVALGYCPGGPNISWPVGYFPVLDQPDTPANASLKGFVSCYNPSDRCNPEGNCSFSPSNGFNCSNEGCLNGYDGYMCAGCQVDYFRRGNYCFQCKVHRVNWFVICIVAWILLLAAGIFGGLMNAMGFLQNSIKVLVLLSIQFSVRAFCGWQRPLFVRVLLTFLPARLSAPALAPNFQQAFLLLWLMNTLSTAIIYIVLGISCALLASVVWTVIRRRIFRRAFPKARLRDITESFLGVRMKIYLTRQLYSRRAVGIGGVKALLFFLQMSGELIGTSNSGSLDVLHLTALSANFVDGPECVWPQYDWFHIQQSLTMILPLVVLFIFLFSGTLSYAIVRVFGAKCHECCIATGHFLCCRCCRQAPAASARLDVASEQMDEEEKAFLMSQQARPSRKSKPITAPLLAGLDPEIDYQAIESQSLQSAAAAPPLGSSLPRSATLDHSSEFGAGIGADSIDRWSSDDEFDDSFSAQVTMADDSTQERSLSTLISQENYRSMVQQQEAKPVHPHVRRISGNVGGGSHGSLNSNPSIGSAESRVLTGGGGGGGASAGSADAELAPSNAKLASVAAYRTFQQCGNILLFMSLIMYFQVSLAVYRSLDCKRDPFTGNRYVTFSPNEPCVHSGYFMVVTILGVVFGVVGIPALWLSLIVRNFSTLNQVSTRSWLGVLYGDYHKRFSWWQVVEAASYTSIAIVSTFCGKPGCIPFWASIVLILFLMFHVYCRPHKVRMLLLLLLCDYAAVLLLTWDNCSCRWTMLLG